MRVIREGDALEGIAAGEPCVVLHARDSIDLMPDWSMPDDIDIFTSPQLLADEQGLHGAHLYDNWTGREAALDRTGDVQALPTWGVITRFPLLCGTPGWWRGKTSGLRLQHTARPFLTLFQPRPICPELPPLPRRPVGSAPAYFGMLEQVVEQNPNDLRTLGTLVESLLKAGYTHQARAYLETRHNESSELSQLYEKVLRAMLADPSSDGTDFYCYPLWEALCRLQPEKAENWYQLAENRLRCKDFAAADEAARKALELQPSLPAAHATLAEVARHHDDSAKELAHRQAAFDLDPDSLDHRRALVMLLGAEDGIALLEQAVRENPYEARARNMVGHHRLYRGQMDRETWQQHEWRETHHGSYRFGGWGRVSRRERDEVWDGQDLGQGTLLVRAEQGFGDCLQFLRFLAPARQLCGKLVLAVRPRLERLALSCPGVDLVVSPPWSKVRCQAEAQLLRLPVFLDFSATAVPYLFAQPAEVEAWGAFLGPKTAMRVGLVWNGSQAHGFDARRSTNLLAFRPLWSLDGFEFHSLQLDAQETSQSTEGRVLDFTQRQTDWASTAAYLAHLDLVVTVDTAVAHLAGALGKKVWLLLTHRWEEWRWGDESSTTPWYPNTRIFRKSYGESWMALLQRVSDELS